MQSRLPLVPHEHGSNGAGGEYDRVDAAPPEDGMCRDRRLSSSLQPSEGTREIAVLLARPVTTTSSRLVSATSRLSVQRLQQRSAPDDARLWIGGYCHRAVERPTSPAVLSPLRSDPVYVIWLYAHALPLSIDSPACCRCWLLCSPCSGSLCSQWYAGEQNGRKEVDAIPAARNRWPGTHKAQRKAVAGPESRALASD
jgi:hypothetical protein